MPIKGPARLLLSVGEALDSTTQTDLSQTARKVKWKNTVAVPQWSLCHVNQDSNEA